MSEIKEHKDGNIIIYRKSLYQTIYTNHMSCKGCIAWDDFHRLCDYHKLSEIRNNNFIDKKGCFRIQGIKRYSIIF